MDNKAVITHIGKEQTAMHNMYNFTNVVSRKRSQSQKHACKIILLNDQEKLIMLLEQGKHQLSLLRGHKRASGCW